MALAHRFGEPTAPARPDDIVESDVCAVSGMLPGAHCHARKHERFIAGTVPAEPCTWHKEECGQETTAYPAELRGFMRAQGLLRPPPCGPTPDALRILFPAPGSHFLIDPGRPLEHQIPPLRASPVERQAEIRWTIDDLPVGDFRPKVGEHRVRATWGGAEDEVKIYFD
jgi:penicillin-binding protein 1C